jgi:hypothetical protein
MLIQHGIGLYFMFMPTDLKLCSGHNSVITTGERSAGRWLPISTLMSHTGSVGMKGE